MQTKPHAKAAKDAKAWGNQRGLEVREDAPFGEQRPACEFSLAVADLAAIA